MQTAVIETYCVYRKEWHHLTYIIVHMFGDSVNTLN